MARKYKRDRRGRFAGGGGGSSVGSKSTPAKKSSATKSAPPAAPAKAKGKRKPPVGVRVANRAKRAAKNPFVKKVAIGTATGLALAAADKATRMAVAGPGEKNAAKRSQAAANIARATLAAAKNATGEMAVAKKTGKNRYNVRSGTYY